MSNSYLLNESPGWSKIIADSYVAPNAQEEANEALEQENDETRIDEAGVPLKVIESIIDFSESAAKLKKGLDEKADLAAERLNTFGENAFDGEEVEQTKKAIDKINDDLAKLDNEQIQKHVNNGDILKAKAVEEASQPLNRREKIAFIKNEAANIGNKFYREIENFTTSSNKTINDPSLSPAEFRELYDKWLKASFIQPLQKRGFKAKFIEDHTFDAVKAHRASKKKKNDEIIEAEWNRTQKAKKFNNIRSVFNSDGYLEEFKKSVEIDSTRYGEGNKGKQLAARDKILTAIAAAGNGDKDITLAKVRALIENYEIDHAGSGNVLYVDQFKNIALEFNEALDTAQKKLLNAEDVDKRAYISSFVNDMRAKRKENGGSYTQTDLTQNIRDNWKFDKYGEPPTEVKGFVTDEVKEDSLTVPYLQHQWDHGLLTEDMVYMLNDAEERTTWLSRVGELSPNAAIDSTELTAGKDAAVGYAKDQSKLTGGKGTLSSEVENNIKQNAEWYYPGLVSKHFNKGANSMQDAIIAAREEMKELVINNKWDKLVSSSTDVNERKRNLAMAQEHFKYDKDVINTGILAGSESILDEAEKLHKKNIAHPFYVQLSKTIKEDGKSLHPLKLQANQLAVKGKLENTGEPVKSVVLEAWEKLPETTRELLSNHVSPARLARAKIEAFFTDGKWNRETMSFGEGDGVIDYSDPSISELADEILKNEDGKYDDFFGYGDGDEKFSKEEIIFEPKKLKRLSKQQLMRRNMSNYRADDGEAAEKLKTFIKNIPSYPGIIASDIFATEIEAIKQVSEGIGDWVEKREEEVREQREKSKSKRKRRRY